MTTTLRFTPPQLRRFADASGDHNPLHLDEAFARATPYGRCIAHGALVAIAALGRAGPDSLERIVRLDIQFKHPVFPCEVYSASRTVDAGDTTRVEVTGGGRLIAAISIVADAEAPALAALADDGHAVEVAEPRHLTVEHLAERPEPVTRSYGCLLPELRDLAADVGGRPLPDAVLTWLAAASYCVGMLIPGRDAVFAGARLARSASASPAAPGSSPSSSAGALTARVTAADERTGFVAVDARLEGEAAARMSLQTFVRRSVPRPDPAAVRRHLAPSSELATRNVLVIGASRGLGAALAGTFATQGAVVWAGYSRSGEHIAALRRGFGEEIRPLRFDAADAHACGAALAAIERGSLDGIVLCAAPAAADVALHPEALEPMLRFIDESIALTLVPLAHALPLLSPRGWIVLISSPALASPPSGALHQVAAKAAVEGVAAYCAAHSGARVLVVRPPTMWTDSTNTPMGRIGAAAPEEIAAEVVRWTMSEQPEARSWALGPDGVLRPFDGRGNSA